MDKDANKMMKKVRISEPMESTRLVSTPKIALENRDIDDELRQIKPNFSHLDDTMNDSEISVDGSHLLNNGEREHFKTEFNGLNHKLGSFVNRLRQNETNLAQCEEAKQVLEKQIAFLKQSHSEQVNILRSQLDENVQKAVIAEERVNQYLEKLNQHEHESKNQKNTIERHLARQEELERILVEEKKKTSEAIRKVSELKESLAKSNEHRESLKKECFHLKVESAKLQERVNLASIELSMQESKMCEVEKELRYSSQDVTKKLNEQRARLESKAKGIIEEMRRNYEAELERNRKKFEKNLHETLKTFVSAEEHSLLEAECKNNLKRAISAENQSAEYETRIKALCEEIKQLNASHCEEMNSEKQRRERLNKRLLAQTKNHEEIRQELENYRKLIETFDLDENGFFRTPIGGNRTRNSLELASPTVNSGDHVFKTDESTPVTFEARKALLKKALTPRRRLCSGGEEKAVSGTFSDLI